MDGDVRKEIITGRSALSPGSDIQQYYAPYREIIPPKGSIRAFFRVLTK
jgi:hypothetical protein